MKIVLINSYDGNGGAARAALRLHHALKQEGQESEFIVNYKYGKDPEIKTFSNSTFSRLYSFFLIGVEQLLVKLFAKKIKIPFSLPFIGKSIETHPLIQQADIIHLHWTNQGFLTANSLRKLFDLGKPIVWTFHDSFAFTGGCHVRYTCDHYKDACGNCPVLKNPKPNDLSNLFWKRKMELYKGRRINIITPSNWLADAVRQSSLLHNQPIKAIPNAIDTAVFLPVSKQEARQQLGLSADKFIMLSGFMPSKVDMHKGTGYLFESLKTLAEEVNPDNLEVLIFGNKPQAISTDFPFQTTLLGTINDDKKLALAYSAADVFLTTSIEDNLPNTVMESLACGTPVIAFTTGGIPDMVEHKKNGYLAQYKSSRDFTDGIKWALTEANRQELRTNARRKVEKEFSMEAVAKKHIEVYKELLNR